MVLEKTLKSPLDCREFQPVHPKGDQPWVFIGRTDVEAKTPILWHLTLRADSLEKTLILGKIEGRRTRRQQRMRCLDGWLDGHGFGWTLTLWTWVWVDSENWWWTGRPGVLRFMGSQRIRHDWVTKLNWTELKSTYCLLTDLQEIGRVLFLFWSLLVMAVGKGVKMAWRRKEERLLGRVQPVRGQRKQWVPQCRV